MSAPNTSRRQRQAVAAPVHALNVVRLFSEDRPPIVQRRFRGRYPKGVVPIRAVSRLKIGARVEFLSVKRPENDGASGVITEYNGGAGYCYLVKFDRDIICNDGKSGREVWCREKHLRRVWDCRQVDEIRRMKALARIDTPVASEGAS